MSLAEKQDLEQIIALWKDCFGDSERYIGFFLSQGCCLDNTLVYRQDGKICAMLFLLNCGVNCNGRVYPGYYVYAVGTASSCRGKGYASALMESAADIAWKRDKSFLCLVPSNPSLFQFYENCGFSTLFRRREILYSLPRRSCPSIPEGFLQSCDLQDFITMRHNAFEGKPYSVRWGYDGLCYRYQETAFTGGKIVKIVENYGQGYAICYKIKNEVVVKEFSCSAELESSLFAAICRFFHTGHCRLYTSCDYYTQHPVEMRNVPFGMIRKNPASSLPCEPKGCWYLNLALD